MSPLAYLARYARHGQHRRGRMSVAEQLGETLAANLDDTRARLAVRHTERGAARRRHPAGRRLAGGAA